MKKLLNEWREYSQYHEIFERHEYIEYALGFKPLLSESGGTYYTPEMRSQIIEEHILFEGFFPSFNPIKKLKKYGKEVGQLFSTLYSIIRNPKYIPDFISSATKKIINVWKEKITSAIAFLENKNMPTFAAGLKKVISAINSITSMAANWKKAILITGLIIGISYLFEKLEDYGADILGVSNIEASIEQVGDKALKAIENFFAKEFPKFVANLYGKAALAASTGFLGWVAGAVAAMKVVNLAKDALVPMFDRFKELTRRRDARAQMAQDGRVRLEIKSRR